MSVWNQDIYLLKDATNAFMKLIGKEHNKQRLLDQNNHL